MTADNCLEGKKVLLVDDEPDVLDSLEDLLSMCETQRADRYEDACRLIDTETFDLAILDIMGVSGYRLLDRCVAKGITAVMLTARALTSDDVVKSYKQGAAYFVPKEEMVRIETFLTDILEAQARGKSTWGGWYERLAAFGERIFDAEFDPDDKDFLSKLIKY